MIIRYIPTQLDLDMNTTHNNSRRCIYSSDFIPRISMLVQITASLSSPPLPTHTKEDMQMVKGQYFKIILYA